MNLTKLIPGYIEIRSLYWVRYVKRMRKDIATIRELIDRNQYAAADMSILAFKNTYKEEGPAYVVGQYREIYLLEAVLAFLYTGSA